MSLSRSPSCQSVFSCKTCKFFSVKFASLNCESCDHLVVSKRYISSSCRFCDIRVLHFRREFIDICDLKSCSFQWISYKASDYVLRSTSCSYCMASKDIQVDFRVYAIVFCDDYTESTKAVFQDRKTFLYMVFTVHTKFCCTTTSCYSYTFVCA